MTTTLDHNGSLDLHDDQGGLDSGPSLAADPWTDTWALPTAQELKAVGWPGARPGLVVDVREDESVLEPEASKMPVEDNSGPTEEMSGSGHFPPPPAPSF